MIKGRTQGGIDGLIQPIRYRKRAGGLPVAIIVCPGVEGEKIVRQGDIAIVAMNPFSG